MSYDSPVELPNEELEKHKEIASYYKRLYREYQDPRWLREFFYHNAISGERKDIENLGVVYREEIFWAGNYWFRVSKNFKDALWAFRTAYSLGSRDLLTLMRLAACLVRIQPTTEGKDLYDDLVKKYPSAINIKTSYIDSLIYIKEYQQALDKLEEFQLTEDLNSWVAGEYGRAYFGLHKYRNSVNALEKQLRDQKDVFVYDILASAYHRLGDVNGVERILNEGKRFHKNSNRLMLRYAAHLIRLGQEKYAEAYTILDELYEKRPDDGRILQQYCKILCRDNRVDEADELLKAHKGKIFPKEYQIMIEVEISLGKKKWNDALSKLGDIPADNEHLVGMKKKIFLSWAKNEQDYEERRDIAKRGLGVKMDKKLEANIPLMVLSARLSRIADEETIFRGIIDKINVINPRIATELEEEDESYLIYWQDDLL